MATAERGNTVKVNYTGRLNDGTVFDSSENREPLEFELGEGQVIPGFEEGVMGMSTGQSKTITIPADQAYGPHRPELQVVVDRKEFPEDMDPQAGDQLQLANQAGETMIVTVADVNDQNVTLDANHPLAGKDLTFDIELVDVR